MSSFTFSDALPAVKYSPAGHVVAFGVHAVALVVPVLYCLPGQCVQDVSSCFFSDAVPAVKYAPAGHVVAFAVHEVALVVPALYCPPGHAVHDVSSSVFSDAVPAVKYSPVGQLVALAVHAVTTGAVVVLLVTGSKATGPKALVPAVYCLSGQGVHDVSSLDFCDAAPAVKYFPAPQNVALAVHNVAAVVPAL